MITRKPKKGDRIKYDYGGYKTSGAVTRTEGNMCHYLRDDNGEPDLFIWRFHDRLNRLFEIEGR